MGGKKDSPQRHQELVEILRIVLSLCRKFNNRHRNLFKNITLEPIREAFLADQTLPVPGAITIALAGAGPGAFPPAGRRATG